MLELDDDASEELKTQPAQADESVPVGAKLFAIILVLSVNSFP